MSWDPRLVFAKLLISPVSIFLPHFSPPYGAGISIFVRESLAIADDVDSEPFGLCRGWFGATGDCWASKGYQRVGIRTPDGAEVDLYNTHLEAGPSEHAAQIRGQQLELIARAIEARPKTRAVIVGGDFNIAPADRDLHDPAMFADTTHTSRAERERLDALVEWGLVDVFREHHSADRVFSWWDYRGGDFHQGRGMRIDLLMCSAPVVDRTRWCVIDRNARKGKQPSDHAPVIVDLN